MDQDKTQDNVIADNSEEENNDVVDSNEEGNENLDGTGTAEDGQSENGEKNSAENADGSDSEQSGKDETKGKTSAYIKQLKRENRQARKEKAEAERRAAELESQLKSQQAPSRDDFDSDDEYIEAKVNYEVSKKTGGQDVASNLTGYAPTFVEVGIDPVDARELSDSMLNAQKSHKDYVEVTGKANGLTKEVFEGLVEVDDPGEMLYYLATHQAELDKIAQLQDEKAIVVQLGRLEARLELESEKHKTSRTTSNAPDPIKPVSGKGGSPTDNVDTDTLTDDEYFARRNAELLRERGLS